MRWLSFVASFALIAAVSTMGVGCKKSPNNSSGGNADWGSLEAPTFDNAEIKQGEKAKLTVKITRKEGKKDKVTLTVDAPEGITATDKSKELKDDEKEATFTLTAGAKAEAKTYTITVKSEPGGGSKTVELKVKKKD